MRRPKSAFLCLLLVGCQQAAATPTLLPTETPAGLTPRPAVKTPTPAPEASPTRPPTLTAPPATPTAEPPKPWGPTTDCPAQTSQAFEFAQPDSIDDLIAQILAYLNSRGSSDSLLKALSEVQWDPTRYSPYLNPRLEVSELTGEGRPEILMVIGQPTPLDAPVPTAALIVLACQNHEFGLAYQTVVGVVPSLKIIDMDRNDFPEIIYSFRLHPGSGGGTLLVGVLGWDGSRVVSRLSPVPWEYPTGLLVGDSASGRFFRNYVPGENVAVFYGSGVARGEEVRTHDIDGDGKLELLLRNGIAWYFDVGPQRVRTDILKWNDGLLEYAYSEHTPAEFRFQAVQDGDDATRFGFYEKALAHYQDAIYDPDLRGWSQGQFWPDWSYTQAATPQPLPTPDPNERPRLEAYARYRIMLLHAVRGYADALETVYQTLVAKVPAESAGYPYAQLATAFYETFNETGDLTAACESAIAFAASHKEEIVAPLDGDFYGDAGGFLWVEDLCPFRE